MAIIVLSLYSAAEFRNNRFFKLPLVTPVSSVSGFGWGYAAERILAKKKCHSRTVKQTHKPIFI